MGKKLPSKSPALLELNDSKTFIEYSSDLDDIYQNIKEYNPNRKCKILIVFGDMTVDMSSNKKLNVTTATELVIRGRKLNISLVFITQSYFAVPKNIRLNSTYDVIVKIPNIYFIVKLQQIVYNLHQILIFKAL